MTISYHVVLQCWRGRGWTECAPHEARRWAVVETRSFQKRGRRFQTTRFIVAFATSAPAYAEAIKLNRISKPLPRPLLGGRFQRTQRNIIAEGGRRP